MQKAIFLKTFTVVVTLVVAALGSGAAMAEPMGSGSHNPDWAGHDTHGKQGEGHNQWLAKLNLSADQKTKIDQIRTEQHEAMKVPAEQLRAEHEKMKEMMKGNATDAELREQHGKVHALRAAMGDARFESFLKIRALLSGGQRKRMAMMHHEGMGHGGMPHGEPGMKDPAAK